MEKDTQKGRDRLFSHIAAGMFLILSLYALFSAVIMIIAKNNSLIRTVQNSEIPNKIFAFVLTLVTLFLAYSLFKQNKTQCMLANGCLLLYKIIEIIYLISTKSYSKFLVMVADIFVLIMIGLIFGILFEANRLQVSYKPPKSRYLIVILYAVFRALNPILDNLISGANFSSLQIFLISVNIALYTTAFFFTVKSMVKPIIPKFEQI